jgi:nucleoside-diphosphate-sugar epimerase
MKTPQNTYNINVGGFNNVIEFARKAKVKKMIYASSSAVYGNTSFGSSIKETSPKYPLSPYGLSKYSNEIFAEKYSGMFNLSSVGLRFFNVYGKRQKVDSEYSGVISIFNNKMSQSTNPSIYGDGEQVRDFIFVDDVVNALVASIYCSNGSYIFNVGTGKKTTINQLYLLLGEIYGFYIKPNYKKPRVGDIRGSIANLDEIKSELNWIPKTNLSDGLLKL